MTKDKNKNEYCRKCDNCGMPLNDIFITRCPRCNSVLKPIAHSCDGCSSKSSCSLKFDFDNKEALSKK
jgi:hypothetical protein